MKKDKFSEESLKKIGETKSEASDKSPLSTVENMTLNRDVKGLIAILSSVDSSSGVDKNSDVEAAVIALGNIENKKAIQPLIDIYYLDDNTIDLDISDSILWALHKITKKHNMNPVKYDVEVKAPLNQIEGLSVCPRCDTWYDKEDGTWQDRFHEHGVYYCDTCIAVLSGNY